MMRRREVISLLGGAGASCGSSAAASVAGFCAALSETGYVEGHNVTTEY